MRTYDVCARTSRDPSGRDRIEFARAPRRPDGTRATIQSMIHSRGRRHWCPLFGSEHVRGSRSSGRAAGTAAGASVRSARTSRASRLKRAFARVSRNAPSWSRTGTPRRLSPTRSETDSPAPRSSSMRALDTSAALATRARDPSWRPRRARREEGRDAQEDSPAAPTPRRTKCARSRRCAKKANEEKRRCRCEFSSSACGRKTLASPLLNAFKVEDSFQKWNVSNSVAYGQPYPTPRSSTT